MLRLRQAWNGKLVLQIQVERWYGVMTGSILVWRDATVDDILNGGISNEKLTIGIPSNHTGGHHIRNFIWTME